MDLDRLGRGVRALRHRRRWRQQDLADAAGVWRSQVSRLELGDCGPMTVRDVDSVVSALGARLDVLLPWQAENLDRMLDEAHAALVEYVARRLAVHGWMVAVEVTFSKFGERGAIDVLAFHPDRRALVVIEVKSVTPDMQLMLGGMDRKARLAPSIARERGWDATSVARVLVLADTRTNRRRLEAHEATVRAALPAGTREITRWLADPAGPGPAGTWFVSPAHTPGIDAGIGRRRRVRVPGSSTGSGPGTGT